MPSFKECAQKALKDGKIDKATLDFFDESVNAGFTMSDLVEQVSRRKREIALQTIAIKKAINNAGTHPDSFFEGAMALMSKDPKGRVRYRNVDSLHRALAGRFQAKLTDANERLKPKMLGFYEERQAHEMFVRAIFGEDVPDADIQGFGKAVRELTEEIRVELNKRGASISKREDWNLFQIHNQNAVIKAGRQQWKDEVLPLLDRTKMLDDTGKQLDDSQMDLLLDYVFETIESGGLNKVKPGAVPRMGKKLARRGSEQRVLHFAGADEWMQYHDKYGQGTVHSALNSWIDNRSGDMALMEIFGPDPDQTFKVLEVEAKKRNATAFQRQRMGWLYNVASGKINQGEVTTWADRSQVVRNLLTASTLGKAFISSITDVGFSMLTANFNNIPAYRILTRQMQMVAGKEQRLFAEKLGFIADTSINTMNRHNRYTDQVGLGKSGKIAEGVMRASFLQPWTETMRKSFSMEFSAMLAENFGKRFDQLDDSMRRQFDLYGIDEKKWDAFRQTEPLKFDNTVFADVTKEGGVDFHRMIISESDYAVPNPDARTMAWTTMGLERGTVAGQGWRAVMMLKSFPITMVLTHGYRLFYQAGSSGSKLKYAATMLGTTSVLGAVAIQAKDIAAGRDPRDSNNPEFWVAAMSQGGGFGILGDFVFSDVNRFGGGIVDTMIGPYKELIDKSAKLTFGNVREAAISIANGDYGISDLAEATDIGPELINYVERYTPTTWQIQLFKQALFDQVQAMADPDFEVKQRRLMKRREREFNQGYWWKPGEIAPSRAPEIIGE